jgi:hypothetical protein
MRTLRVKHGAPISFSLSSLSYVLLGVLDHRVPLFFGLLYRPGDGVLDRRLPLLCRGLLWWRGDLGLWVPLLWYASSSFADNFLPTIFNPFSAARCICSLGSPGFGHVVCRYAWAATNAALGVFGILFPCSSTDWKDESRFFKILCLSEYSRFSYLDPCRWCLLFVYDASLRALRAVSLAVMAESFLFCISILSFANCFAYCLRA